MTEGMRVEPRRARYAMLLTFQQPVSHHDPATADSSNQSLFNRQGQLVQMPTGEHQCSLPQMAFIAAGHRVPDELWDVFDDMPFGEFVAVVLIRLFVEIYGGSEGSGLFAGMERYRYLETRMRTAAIPSQTLRAFWGRLCKLLKVGVHAARYDTTLLELLVLPAGTQAQVLRVLIEQSHSVIPIARVWSEYIKRSSAEYAKATGKEQLAPPNEIVSFGEQKQSPSGARVIEVPSVSANSVRHSLVREPGFMHMAERLGLLADTPGQGPLPPMVEALFVNGGNLEGSAPSNAFALAHEVRARYPLLDLLGGCAGTFFLRDSRLQVGAWLVCSENWDALPEGLALAEVSAFDQLDDVTLTRRATDAGLGQMITGFEALKQGAQVYVELDLLPQTHTITHGALLASTRYAMEQLPTLGGQGARGYGRYDALWMRTLDGAEEHEAEYEAYLVANRDELVDGLLDGTLGTGKTLLS